MTVGKRILDIVLVIIIAPIASVLCIAAAAAIVVSDGFPVFYRSERMKSVSEGFQLWKFRTMRTCDDDSGVSGGDKAERITKVGSILRRFRLDEIPQIWNILKGDMSVVGPRPPLRQYTKLRPDLYRDVLRSRPGIAGLATLIYHNRETELLKSCKTWQETNSVYERRCIPAKARLDLIYQENSSICFDLWIIYQTMRSVLKS